MVGERSELSANRFLLPLGVSPIRAKMRTGDARRTKTGLFAVMEDGGGRSELSANRFPLRLGVSPIRAKMRTRDARRTKTGLFAVMDSGELRYTYTSKDCRDSKPTVVRTFRIAQNNFLSIYVYCTCVVCDTVTDRKSNYEEKKRKKTPLSSSASDQLF